MKLYFHYCASSFSNCYILGAKNPTKEAIIIDPASMDSGLLNLIEDNNYNLMGIFLTHDHRHHAEGLKTLLKIYDAKIYAISPEARGHNTIRIKDGEVINIGPFKIEVFSVPGHSSDSVVFKIGQLLFTGDTLSAGLIGSTPSSFSRATLVNGLRKKIFSLPGDYTVLPGHGPPSSLEAERRFNLGMNTFEQEKNRRPGFKIEY